MDQVSWLKAALVGMRDIPTLKVTYPPDTTPHPINVEMEVTGVMVQGPLGDDTVPTIYIQVKEIGGPMYAFLPLTEFAICRRQEE